MNNEEKRKTLLKMIAAGNEKTAEGMRIKTSIKLAESILEKAKMVGFNKNKTQFPLDIVPMTMYKDVLSALHCLSDLKFSYTKTVLGMKISLVKEKT